MGLDNPTLDILIISTLEPEILSFAQMLRAQRVRSEFGQLVNLHYLFRLCLGVSRVQVQRIDVSKDEDVVGRGEG